MVYIYCDELGLYTKAVFVFTDGPAFDGPRHGDMMLYPPGHQHIDTDPSIVQGQLNMPEAWLPAHFEPRPMHGGPLHHHFLHAPPLHPMHGLPPGGVPPPETAAQGPGGSEQQPPCSAGDYFEAYSPMSAHKQVEVC